MTWHGVDGNLIPFKWDAKRHKAATLLAEGNTAAKVAAAIGVDIRVIAYWRRHPDFSRQVKRIIDDAAIEATTIGIANIVSRVRAYDDLFQRYQKVLEERAENPDGDGAPGMTSGIMVKKERTITTRSSTTTEIEYQVDNATSAEMRALLKQAAQETGQWSEKSQVELSGGVERSYVVEDLAGGVIRVFDIEEELREIDREPDEETQDV